MKNLPFFEFGYIALIVYCAVIGGLWGIVGLYCAFVFQIPSPQLTISGAIEVIIFLPTWVTLIMAQWISLQELGIVGMFCLASLFGAIVGCLVGMFLVWRIDAPI